MKALLFITGKGIGGDAMNALNIAAYRPTASESQNRETFVKIRRRLDGQAIH